MGKCRYKRYKKSEYLIETKVIHEFDPHFNYRATKVAADNGIQSFLHWFDDRSWYPLGRIVGGTVYPGLMLTASAIYHFFHRLGLPIAIRNVCVLLSPLFSVLSSLALYHLTLEATSRVSTALLASALIAIVPSYLSRSVSGSFDNEGIAIFAMISILYLWLRALRIGSILSAAFVAFAYLYMVMSWGGYIFVINLIPLHVLALVLMGRYSSRLYIAYCGFYVLGTLLSMQIPFVGFQTVQQAETLASHGIFGLLQRKYTMAWLKHSLIQLFSVIAFSKYIQYLSPTQRLRDYCIRQFKVIGLGSFVVLGLVLNQMGWSGRTLTLLDPTYAAKYVPIIASVSEHQPAAWGSFYSDFGPILFFVPVGLFVLFEELTSPGVFLIIYSVISWYFAGIMVRLTLVLAPAACILAAIGISTVLTQCFSWCKDRKTDDSELSKSNEEEDVIDMLSSILQFKVVNDRPKGNVYDLRYSIFGLILVPLTLILVIQVRHCSLISSTSYASPSITYPVYDNGTLTIHDDLREAYYWLRQNTASDAKILAWWDYGYQLSSLSNRTVIVDNNTWNNTHIATVGRVFGSEETQALSILQSLDVDYVFVIFGAVIGSASDDLNKFPWFVRIAQGVYPDVIKEEDFTVDRRYLIHPSNATDKYRNSLIYKLSYYRFNEAILSDPEHEMGYDPIRRQSIGKDPIHLKHFTEEFTSKNWMVRLYKVQHGLYFNSYVKG